MPTTILRRMLSISHFKLRKGVVLLCPISRTLSLNFHLQRIGSLLESQSVGGAIIINKTRERNLSGKLSGVNKTKFIEELIRPPSEPIFISQSLVSINEGQWIMQVHDDDDFHGRIDIDPGLLEDHNKHFVPNLYLLREKAKVVDLTSEFPNHAIFTAVPSRTWNAFTSVIKSSNPILTNHLDYVLSRCAKLANIHTYLPTFSYYYNATNWSGTELKRHSRKLYQELLPELTMKQKMIVIYLDRFFATLALLGNASDMNGERKYNVYFEEKQKLIEVCNLATSSGRTKTNLSLKRDLLRLKNGENAKLVVKLLKEIESNRCIPKPKVISAYGGGTNSSQLKWLIQLWSDRLEEFARNK